MEALEKRVDEIDSRLRIVEQDNCGMGATLSHFTASVENFINTLKEHETKEDARFEKFEKKLEFLTKISYFGLGVLAIAQFLISNDILSFGTK